MRRALQICLIVLVALTTGHMQVFGIHRDSVCLDFAQPQATEADHCHRSAETTAVTPCDNEALEADCPPGALSQHAEGNVQFDSIERSPSEANSITAPGFVPLATLTDLAVFEPLSILGSRDFRYRPKKDIGKHLTTSVQVAKSVTLLV